MKNFYKKFLVLSFLVIFEIWGVFADCEDCKIRDEMAPPLFDYLEDIKTIRRNITNSVRKEQREVKISRSKYRKLIQASFNVLFDWEEYYGGFNYYIELATKQSVSYEVKRDFNLIKREKETLIKQFETLTERGYQNVKVSKEDACNWVKNSNNCSFSGETAGVMLQDLHTSLNKVHNFFVNSILGKQTSTEWISFIPENFSQEMMIYYTENTNEDCNKCEGWSTSNIEEKIEEITSLNAQWKKWMQEWIDAWNILAGNYESEKKRQLERELLSKELGRQGISWENKAIIMGNLEKYNNKNFYSLDNNFISNTFSSVANSIWKQLSEFNESVLQLDEKKSSSNTSTQTDSSSSFKELDKTQEKVNQSDIIKKEIAQIYENEVPYTQIEETKSEQAWGRMLEVHINLTESINRLDEVISISQKVCNDQVRGMGNCN